MAKREISIVLRARNAMMAGIAGAKRTLSAFGGFVSGVGRSIAYGFMAAGTAIVGFGAIAMRAYSQSEAADKALSSALKIHGDAVEDLMPKYRKIAEAIQEATGVEDDATLAGMATMRMLGVQADELEGAAKAVIALKSANIDGESAQKAVALAIAGNYRMLSRQIPALRGATSEAEKARIVNDFLTAGYQQQKDMLSTTGGAWALLKVHVGNALENIGEAINKNEAITRVLNAASGAVKRFGDAVKEYIDSAEFKKIQESVEGIISAIGRGGDDRDAVFEAFSGAISAAFELAAIKAVDILKEAAGEIGSLIGKGVIKSRNRVIKNLPDVLSAASNPAAIPGMMWGKMFSMWRKKETTPQGAVESIQATNKRKELEAWGAKLLAIGAESAAKMATGIESAGADIPPVKISVAGKGSPAAGLADVAEEVSASMSSMMERTLDHFRQMGHDVEELGMSAQATKAQQQARDQMARDRQTALMEQSLGVEEETRDLLRENLKAK
jgi:hypothetical protein